MHQYFLACWVLPKYRSVQMLVHNVFPSYRIKDLPYFRQALTTPSGRCDTEMYTLNAMVPISLPELDNRPLAAQMTLTRRLHRECFLRSAGAEMLA